MVQMHVSGMKRSAFRLIQHRFSEILTIIPAHSTRDEHFRVDPHSAERSRDDEAEKAYDNKDDAPDIWAVVIARSSGWEVRLPIGV